MYLSTAGVTHFVASLVPVGSGVILLMGVLAAEARRRGQQERRLQNLSPDEKRAQLEVDVLKRQLSLFGSLLWPLLILVVPIASSSWIQRQGELNAAQL